MKVVTTYELPITIESSNSTDRTVFVPQSGTFEHRVRALRIIDPQRDFDIRLDGTLEVNLEIRNPRSK